MKQVEVWMRNSKRRRFVQVDEQVGEKKQKGKM